ncbi:MAG: hypothetical protein IT354_17455 [Gemmatimonadaceae bacterium]|nr:hypothetical protein [Gemmatimonadaceae bacterium]
MPNGNHEFDLGAQEEWFASIAPAITAFADTHRLFVDKYYRDHGAWELRFNHPRGGQADVSVGNLGPSLAYVGAQWYLDDYDSFSRSLYWRDQRDIAKVPEVVARELGVELRAILAVPLGQWRSVVSDYQDIWGQHTKAEFERMARTYPMPMP